MSEHYCHIWTRVEGREEKVPCDEPVKWKVGRYWYCTEHYDKFTVFMAILKRKRQEARMSHD